MNGGQWRYTPQNPLFSGYNFLSSNLNVVFERRCKEITHCWVLDFLESLICFKKSFKMSMTSYTSYDQRYCFTAILQSLWCFQRMSMVQFVCSNRIREESPSQQHVSLRSVVARATWTILDISQLGIWPTFPPT